MQAIESREPNVTSLQHILAELERIDLLVHVHVMRAREADDTDGRVKGLYISEQEVDGLLSRPAGLPRWAVASEASETSVGVTLDRLAAEVERLEAESARTGETLRLVALARKFKLDPFDLDALLVCLAPELDLRYERLYAYLQDDVTRKRPSVDLVLNVLCRSFEEKVSARQRFGPQAPLLKHRLVEMVDDPSQQQPTLLSKHLRVDERVAGYLLDSDEIDQRVESYVRYDAPKTSLEDLLLPEETRRRLRALVGERGACDPVLPGALRRRKAERGRGAVQGAWGRAAGRGRPAPVERRPAGVRDSGRPGLPRGVASGRRALLERLRRASGR